MARSLLAIMLLSFAPLVIATSAARAEGPIDAKADITDNAEVLGNDTARVQKALDTYTDRTGFQLRVVYVDSFDDFSGDEWAQRTAERSGIGTTDTLLAIAIDDRAFGVAEPRERSASDDEITDVSADDIAPAVRAADWPGAAIAAADGYTEAAESSGLPWAWIVAGLAAVFIAIAVVVHRVRREYDDTHVVLDEHGHPIAPAHPHEPQSTPSHQR